MLIVECWNTGRGSHRHSERETIDHHVNISTASDAWGKVPSCYRLCFYDIWSGLKGSPCRSHGRPISPRYIRRKWYNAACLWVLIRREGRRTKLSTSKGEQWSTMAGIRIAAAQDQQSKNHMR